MERRRNRAPIGAATPIAMAIAALSIGGAVAIPKPVRSETVDGASSSQSRLDPAQLPKLKQWYYSIEDNEWQREPVCYAILMRNGGLCTTFTFYKFVPSAGGHAKIWKRYEYFEPKSFNGQSYKSIVWLMEWDCKDGRSRPLEVENYPDSNMGGDPFSPPFDARWSYTVPGTDGEYDMKLACNSTYRKNFTLEAWKAQLNRAGK